MKKLMIKSLAMFIVLAMLNLVSFAQDGREKIKFAKGKTSTILKRTLSADIGTITFILNARKGQTLKFTVESEDDVSVSFAEPKSHEITSRSEANVANEFKSKKTGEHYITVVNRGDSEANITLNVSFK